MRIVHRYLTYNSRLKDIKPLRVILDKYNVSYKFRDDQDSIIGYKYLLEFSLYEDDPFFSKAKGEIDQYGIEAQTGTLYDKADLDKAEWFIIETGEYQYPQPEDDFGYLKVTFDLESHCSLCGIGKVQSAPYRLKTEPKQVNNQFWGLHWEHEPIFVRQETKDILEKEKFQGISFSQPVLHKKNIEVENFYQLHVDIILEQGFDSYNTRTISCKINNEEGEHTDPNLVYCGRIKYHHPMIGGYTFDKAIFNPTLDIMQSHEYFGSGASANRLQIVSKRFKQLIEKNKLKGLSFTPIVHERFSQ